MKYLSNKRGMTLVELMLALALVGIIGLMAAGLQFDLYDHFFRESTSTEFHMDLQTMHQLFRDEMVGMGVADDIQDFSGNNYYFDGGYYYFQWNEGNLEIYENDRSGDEELKHSFALGENGANNDNPRVQEITFEAGDNGLTSEMLKLTIEIENGDNREYSIGVFVNDDVDVELIGGNDKLYFVEVYSLKLSSTSGGSVVNPGEGIFRYAKDTEDIRIEAEADPYYDFDSWTGNEDNNIIDPQNKKTEIEKIDSHKEITAHFVPEDVQSAVDLGWTGGGQNQLIKEYNSEPSPDDENYYSGTAIFTENNPGWHLVGANEETHLEATEGFIFETQLEVGNNGTLNIYTDGNLEFNNGVNFRGGGQGEICFKQKTTVNYEGEESVLEGCYDESDFEEEFSSF